MRQFRHLLRALIFPKPQWKWRGMAFLFALLFGGAGLFLTYHAAEPIYHFWRSGNWVELEAKVLESELEESDDSMAVKVTYEYEFRGEVLVGDQFDFGSASTNIGKAKMRETVSAFPEGKVIAVWVDPGRGERSVIVRQLSYQVWLSVCGSVPFLLVGFCAAVFTFLGKWIWTSSHRLKCELGRVAPGEIREALEVEVIPEDQKLLFTDQFKKLEGIGLCVGVLFGGSIVLLFIIGMVEMLRSGDGLGYFFAFFLLPFVFVIGKMLKCAMESFGGKIVPGWVILSDGVKLGIHGNQGGEVRLSWMRSDLDQGVARVPCRIGLARWRSNQSFEKWREKNPGWEKELQEMPEQGTFTFQLDHLVGKRRFIDPKYDLYLVLFWQGRGGENQMEEFALQLNDCD